MTSHPVIHYPSVEAYRAAIAKPALEGAKSSSGKDQYRSTLVDDHHWDLSAGMAGAQRMAREGWREGATTMRVLAEKIRDALEPPEMLAPAYDVAPFGPDVQLDMSRYVDGDPEHWRVNVPRRGGHITVGVSVGSSWKVPATTLARRSAVGLAIAWVLHDAGYEVDLRAIHIPTSHGRPVGCSWQMPLEPYLVAFWIGHPAAYRRLWFRWLEAHSVQGTIDAYGIMSPESECAALPPGSVYVPVLRHGENDRDYASDTAAIATARRLLGSLDTTTIHA